MYHVPERDGCQRSNPAFLMGKSYLSFNLSQLASYVGCRCGRLHHTRDRQHMDAQRSAVAIRILHQIHRQHSVQFGIDRLTSINPIADFSFSHVVTSMMVAATYESRSAMRAYLGVGWITDQRFSRGTYFQ